MAYKLETEFKSGPGSIPDVIKIADNPATLDPKKTDGRSHRQLLQDVVDTLFGLFRRLTANVIRGSDQKVRNLSKRDSIAPEMLVVGMRCFVANNATQAQENGGVQNGPANFVLLADGAGPLLAYIDAAYQQTNQTTASWVRDLGNQSASKTAVYGLPDGPLAVTGKSPKSFAVPVNMEIIVVWWGQKTGPNAYIWHRLKQKNFTYAGATLTVLATVELANGDLIDVTYNR